VVASVDFALFFVFLALSAFVVFFRRLLRYKNSLLLPVLLAVVLLVNFATKFLTHIDCFSQLSLAIYVVFLDLALGFAAGPTLFFLCTPKRELTTRRLVHYTLCILPLIFFIDYTLKPLPARQEIVLSTINGENQVYAWLSRALLLHLGTYLMVSFAARDRSWRLIVFFGAFAAVLAVPAVMLPYLPGARSIYFLSLSILISSIVLFLSIFVPAFPNHCSIIPPESLPTERNPMSPIAPTRRYMPSLSPPGRFPR